MRQLFFELLARFIVRRHSRVAGLYLKAILTPYSHIKSRDGTKLYMKRYWLFNAYENADGTPTKRNWFMRLLPSIRLHNILLPDDDGPLHDHPWDARTIILQGWYVEEIENPEFEPAIIEHPTNTRHIQRTVRKGYTRVIRYGEFHRIADVSDSPGLLTLFITYKYRGPWGFKVDGQKVHWREYLGIK